VLEAKVHIEKCRQNSNTILPHRSLRYLPPDHDLLISAVMFAESTWTGLFFGIRERFLHVTVRTVAEQATRPTVPSKRFV
jgi:hypothetical protein